MKIDTGWLGVLRGMLGTEIKKARALSFVCINLSIRAWSDDMVWLFSDLRLFQGAWTAPARFRALDLGHWTLL